MSGALLHLVRRHCRPNLTLSIMSFLTHPILAEYSVSHGLMLFAVFGLAGIVMAIIGYKLFDKMTPGNLHQEIFEHKNVAAAVLAGSVIIGVSLILAAAMGN
jgi:uncharacterized membrane protein YjfL (UPF0719 family)